MSDTPAHEQSIANRYVISYPEHSAREGDPHYKDFHAFHKKHSATAKCAWAVETGDFTDCDTAHPIELHHAHVEFAVQNAINLVRLEHAYPGISNPDDIGAWVESGDNFVWLCARHHRAQDGGIHHLAAADYEASKWLQSGVIHEVVVVTAPHVHKKGTT